MSFPLRNSAALASVLFATACFPPGEGVEAPLDRFYFPVGAALSDDGNRLFVANSDFDLQYNSGSLQTIDLEVLRGIDACAEFGEQPRYKISQIPGRCNAVPLDDDRFPLLVDKVAIGAFATEVLRVSNPEDENRSRLFIPTRGDTTVHWIDVGPEGKLDCGQARNSGRCDDAHRAGDDPASESTRDVRLPPEPFGIAATTDGSAIVVTHQTEGKASVLTNSWNEAEGLKLQFVTGDMPTRAIGIAALPTPRAAQAGVADFETYAPGFLMTFRNAAELRLLRYFDDERAAPHRPFLQQAGSVDVRANSVNFDSRGIAVDASRRLACEASCSNSNAACLTTCAQLPVAVYVANRSPASLLVGETQSAQLGAEIQELPRFYDSIPLPFGPSRVVVGDVMMSDDPRDNERRVFVLCFDSRRIVIYDPVRRREEGWIDTGRGPHAMAIDSQHGLGYVVHFTDSYIGVVDLKVQHQTTYGKIITSVGVPKAPRASK